METSCLINTNIWYVFVTLIEITNIEARKNKNQASIKASGSGCGCYLCGENIDDTDIKQIFISSS